MRGTIVNIQHYAVHDGPGIRTLVFFKGCPLRCPWCCNPESQSFHPQIRYIQTRCKLCLECVSNCPHDSVAVQDGRLVHSFEQCNDCDSRTCIEKCNVDAVTLTGREVSSEDLLEIIARDIPFYRNSGGGVTFSGGEPFAQPGFLLEMLQKCHDLGIHTAVETCGWTSWKSIKAVMPYTDLFLFDLKITDPDLHLQHTGKTVAPILENLALLSSGNANIIIRFPLVPGITDFMDNLENIASIMIRNHLKHICLEPYHSLGADKYEEHGMQYTLGSLAPYKAEQIISFAEFFKKMGLICEIS